MVAELAEMSILPEWLDVFALLFGYIGFILLGLTLVFVITVVGYHAAIGFYRNVIHEHIVIRTPWYQRRLLAGRGKFTRPLTRSEAFRLLEHKHIHRVPLIKEFLIQRLANTRHQRLTHIYLGHFPRKEV